MYYDIYQINIKEKRLSKRTSGSYKVLFLLKKEHNVITLFTDLFMCFKEQKTLKDVRSAKFSMVVTFGGSCAREGSTGCHTTNPFFSSL